MQSNNHLNCIQVYKTVLGNSSAMSDTTWFPLRIVFASHAIRKPNLKSYNKTKDIDWNDKLAWCCGRGSCEFGRFIWEGADTHTYHVCRSFPQAHGSTNKHCHMSLRSQDVTPDSETSSMKSKGDQLFKYLPAAQLVEQQSKWSLKWSAVM